MNVPDPRVWALRHPRQTLLVLMILMSVMVVGNALLSRGGMFDGEVIVQTEDPWREMDRYVQNNRPRPEAVVLGRPLRRGR
jgi:hypothetical protein